MWAGGHPVYVAEASGARVVDVDGNEYADFCLGDTGAMAGPHARADHARGGEPAPGITTMLPTEDAAWVGEELARRFGVPLWQFALTATDANRWMLRICRHVTGRPKVLVFNWCYHGSVDEAFVTLGEDGVSARARATSARRSTRPRPRAWPSSTRSSRSRPRWPTATWPAC